MKPSDRVRFTCPKCQRVFVIEFEPDAGTKYRAGIEWEDSPVVCCPFCRGAIREDE